MKRYQITTRALTTGGPLTHVVADTPREAMQLAQKVAAESGRQVEIFDSQTEEFYEPQKFAAAHGL